MQRYFLKTPYVSQEEIMVDGEISHRMIRVMRLKEGGRCFLVFSDEVVVVAEILKMSDQAVWLKEVEIVKKKVELPLHLHIACAFPKGDKAEFITQKSCELGARSIQFFPSDLSMAKWHQKISKKEERLQKIAQEACEQSQRTHLAQVRVFETKEALMNTFSSYDKILVAYEESGKNGEKNTLVETYKDADMGENILFLFGSEGGISPAEITAFRNYGAALVGLGPRIMRCETAPLYALSTASFFLELM